MKIKGKIVDILPKQEGMSKSGTKWATMEFVIQSEESTPQYPNTICFQIYGEDRINKFSFRIGDDVNVNFNINSRKVGNKYYTTISAWGIYAENTRPSYNSNASNQPTDNDAPVKNPSSYDNLPF